MEKVLQILEEGPKMVIDLNSLKATLKKYQTGKVQASIVYTDSGFKNLLPFMTDSLPK